MAVWIIPCNANDYKIFAAFRELPAINWVQKVKNMKPGDTAYIYVGVPYKAIHYQCVVNKVGLEKQTIDDSRFVIDDANYGSYGRYAEFQLLEEHSTPLLAVDALRKHGLRQYPIRNQHQVSDELAAYLLQVSGRVINEIEDKRLLAEVNWSIAHSPQNGYVYKGIKKDKTAPAIKNGQKVFARDKQTAINALTHANFQCEIEAAHPTFIRKNSELPYTEPHHLVPLSYSEQFDVSLDVEENIVSLCSHCHNQLHYGEGAGALLQKLYAQRKEHLKKVGIRISLDELLKLYD